MVTEKQKWVITLFFALILTLLFFLTSIAGFSSSSYYTFTFHKHYTHTITHRGGGGETYPPSFAYYISGGRGDKDRIFRLLLAVYHPMNRYLLHLGAEASDDERSLLLGKVNLVPVIRAFGNVDVVGKPARLTYMGSTTLAAGLRGAAMLMKIDSRWNWFVMLSAGDYPLVTQDDMSHVFSSIGKDTNFIDHTGELGWKESQRAQPIVVDPAIYLARKSQIFQATQKRPTPKAFKFFTGSPWVILSRSFLEFCILGWDNLPRTLLMYFTNIILSEEGYYHTVSCNSPLFRNTTVNSDIRYTKWDSPPKTEPRLLNTSDYQQMVQSEAAFAGKFQKDDPVLNIVDEKILKRRRNRATPGGWCTQEDSWVMDPCSQWGDIYLLKPSLQAKKFEASVKKLIDLRSGCK